MTCRVVIAVTAAMLIATVATGCDSGATSGGVAPGGSTDQTASVDEQAATAREHLVSPSELPGLSGSTTTLNADDIAEEATDPAVSARLEDDGFVVAVRRDLRGRSRTVTGADSRVLVFDDARGAESFVRSVAADPDPFFGGPATVHPLGLGEAQGALIKPPMCACAGAQPAHVALVADGERVLWLQITGPRATASDVKALLGTVL